HARHRRLRLGGGGPPGSPSLRGRHCLGGWGSGRPAPFRRGLRGRGAGARLELMSFVSSLRGAQRASAFNRRISNTQAGKSMKSYHADSGAGLDGLKLKEHDEPKPGPREVLVRVRANSLNFRELSVLKGTYPLPVKAHVVLGENGSGEVE